MSEQRTDTQRCDAGDIRQCMSIHTRKITDSCRDKDCIEDLRVYLTTGSQAILDASANTRVRCAELITTYIDVEPVAFDRNHYCVDLTFYYRILADAVVSGSRPTPLQGLAVFSKRAVLCGEDSRAHIYRSNTRLGRFDRPSTLFANLPTAIVEVLDPMVLASRVKESDPCGCDAVNVQIPDSIRDLYEDPLVVSGGKRQLFVTLGQFSIVRLERSAQLVVPVLDYAIPCKECCENPGGSEDPCEMFSRIPFPAQEFSPSGCDDKDCKDNNYQTC